MDEIKEFKKQIAIKIESVSNGFLVTEDYINNPMEARIIEHPRKVFNTKKQLCSYITKNF